MSLYNFSPGQTGQDPTQQAGYNQYIQQGQNMINPGQATVQASNPIAAAAAANLAKAFSQTQQQPGLSAQQPPQPSVGPNAAMGNLPIAPGMYQSQGALDNAQGPMYPSAYAAQQAQPWLSRMADQLMGNSPSDGGS